MSSLSEPIGRLYLRPMHPRTPGDKARAASAVELFSDLVFATAILFAGSQIHHVLGQGNFGHGVVSYLLVYVLHLVDVGEFRVAVLIV